MLHTRSPINPPPIFLASAVDGTAGFVVVVISIRLFLVLTIILPFSDLALTPAPRCSTTHVPMNPEARGLPDVVTDTWTRSPSPWLTCTQGR